MSSLLRKARPRTASPITAVDQTVTTAHANSATVAPHKHAASLTLRTLGCVRRAGGRIRFSPEAELPSNAGLQTPLATLLSATNGLMSAADAIVLAGVTAIEKKSGMMLPFCAGRGDAADGSG
eukprot:6172996-Pleurochrysis_carterae.AAC.6